MALKQESLLELGLYETAGRRRMSFSYSSASWSELARVELPVLALLAIFFPITFLVNPSLEIGTLGVNLPTLILCPLLALTGVPCLMCGITRSFLAMGGLDLSSAFIFHPLGPLFFLVLVGLAVICVMSLVTRRQFRVSLDSAFGKSMLRASAVIILAAWFVKVVIWYQVGLL